MSAQVPVSVEGTPARIVVGAVWQPVGLLVPEAEKLIVELRNAINAARRRNAPGWKITDLQ